jgi:ATP-binding cassette, subfamily B, bacterial
VLEAGKLAEFGSHDDLAAGGGLYARLWKKQSGVSVTGEEQRGAMDPASLGAIPVFRGVDAPQLVSLAHALSTEHVPAGREVFRQGDRGDRLYVIARGTVVVSSRNDDSGAEEVRAVLQDGDYFGEIALLEDTPRTATVRTRTDCVFLTLPCDAFLKLLEESPELSDKFAQVSRERLASSIKTGSPARGPQFPGPQGW